MLLEETKKQIEPKSDSAIATEEKPNSTNESSQIELVENEEIVVKGGKCYAFFKRTFDIFVSLLAIIILSPILLIIGILVKVTSRGPILFKDKRVGKNGKIVNVYKFRTMYKDAETRIKDYLTEEQYQIWLVERKLDFDPRITKLGHILRKTSIDELPQLFNILFGTMSFVGPRPISELELLENYTKIERKVLLSVRPGLTGYWQTHGRSQVSYESKERQMLELEYFKHRGFWFDIKLIFMTVGVIFKPKEAH